MPGAIVQFLRYNSPTIMQHNTSFIAIWNALRGKLYAALTLLISLRIFFVFFNYQSILGEYWRHETSVLPWYGWISAVAFAGVGFYLQRSYKQSSAGFRDRLLLFLLANYLLLALFNNQINERSYFYLLLDGRMQLTDWTAFLIMDLFFQAPFLFWGLVWFAVTFWLSRSRQNADHLLLLWFLPFIFVDFHVNNFAVTFYLASAGGGLWGFNFGQNKSSRHWYVFWGGSYAILLATFVNKPLISVASLIASVVMLSVVWLTGFWFIRHCEAENTAQAKAVSWFVPVISFGVLHQTLAFVPLARNLFDFWFVMVSLHFVFYAIVAVIALLVIPACFGLLQRRLLLPSFYLCLSVCIGFYFVDAVLAGKSGLRLNYDALSWVAGLESFRSIMLTSLEVVRWWQFLIMVAFFAGMYFLLEKRARLVMTQGKSLIGPTVFALFLISQISYVGVRALTQNSYLLTDPLKLLLATLPIDDVKNVSYGELITGFAKLGINFSRDKSAGKESVDKKNLILIMIESTADQYVSLFGHPEETWPQLAKYKDRMEIFPAFFSNFPESSNADFAVMSGVYPPPYLLLRQNPNVPVQTMVEVLRSQNYDCQMFFSGMIGDTGLSSFYRPRGFSRLYDTHSLSGQKPDDGWLWGTKEYVTVDYINRALDEKVQTQSKQPFFMYYRNVFPHAPFVVQQDGYAVFAENDIVDNSSLVGRFKNCLLYQDAQLVRILDHLDKIGLSKNTYVAIVADHGTMLGEHNLFGHGWNLAPYLTNVPMLIISPEKEGLKVNLNTGSQVDMLPTLLDLINASKPGGEFYEGRNLRESSFPDRPVFLSSMRHKVVVQNNLYYWFLSDNVESAQVYEFNYANNRNQFSQKKDISREVLEERLSQVRTFNSLQKALLQDMGNYKKELLVATGSANF